MNKKLRKERNQRRKKGRKRNNICEPFSVFCTHSHSLTTGRTPSLTRTPEPCGMSNFLPPVTSGSYEALFTELQRCNAAEGHMLYLSVEFLVCNENTPLFCLSTKAPNFCSLNSNQWWLVVLPSIIKYFG